MRKKTQSIFTCEIGECLKKLFSLSLISIALLSYFLAYYSPTKSNLSLGNESTPLTRTEPTAPLGIRGRSNFEQQTIVTQPIQQQLPSDTSQSLTSISYKTYGGVGDDAAYSVIKTSDWGLAMAGYTNSFGAGQNDFWLIKTDIVGNVQWNKTYGGSNDDYAYSIVQTSDNGFALVGSTKSFGAGDFDLWLVKTDPFGNQQWSKTFGGIWEDWGYSLAKTTDGGLVLAGWTASFGLGSGDFWLIKTDGSGNLEWSQTYGDIYYDAASAVIQTVDGGFAVVGSTYSLGNGGSDVWLVKTNNLGNSQWRKTYGGTGNDYGYSLVQTSDNGYAILGSTSSFGAGIYDFWLIKTDNLGQEKWTKTYGGTGYDEAWSLIQTLDGGFALAGWTESFGAGLSDCWLIETDASGNKQNEIMWGASNYDYAYSIFQINSVAYAMAGETSSYGAGSYDSLLILAWKVQQISDGDGIGGGGRTPNPW